MVTQQEDDRDIWVFEIFQDTYNHERIRIPGSSASTRVLEKIEDFKKLVKDH